MSIKPCDQDVFDNGQSVCLVDIPKETAENICRSLSAATGCKIDWHYIGGRVHIKALAAPVVERQPVAYRCRHSVSEPWFFSDKPGYWEWQPLYTSPPAPVAVKDHEFRELVNRLRDTAIQYRDADQLRERISIELRACLDKVKELNQPQRKMCDCNQGRLPCTCKELNQ